MATQDTNRAGMACESRGSRSPFRLFAPGIVVLLLYSAYLPASDSLIPITKTEVLQAVSADLRGRGVHEDQLPHLADVELPASIPAAPGRTVRIVSACWDTSLLHAQFRLECPDAGQCVPFLAYVRGSAEFAGAIGNVCRRASTTRAVRSVPRKPVLRAGDRATVVFAHGKMRLTAVVTCLERGAEGDVIRVRNQDGQVFRARIANPTLLEALP